VQATVIIAQYGEPQLTINCVQSLRRWHGDVPDIVVVDDGSDQVDIEAVARAGLSNVRLLRRPHQGVTAAWNSGAATAEGDVLIFLNNDVITTGRWVCRLTGALADDDSFVAGVEWRTERLARAEALERLPTRGFAAGWCFAVRRGDFQRVGGFREELRLYYSDTDLQARLLMDRGRGGEGITIVPKLALRHLGHATTSKCADRRRQWRADRGQFEALWMTDSGVRRD
jgi:GT2 family glycosyltransferase